MIDLSPEYLLGLLAAALVGMAKTGMPGIAILVVPVMAWIEQDAKGSVGVLLPMFIAADVFAVAFYRHHTDWRMMGRLAPWVFAGILLGDQVQGRVDTQHYGVLLGGLILVLVGLELIRQYKQWHDVPHHPAFSGFMGTMTGFTTMVGNAAGPIMNVYLLCHGLTKQKFIGSLAMFILLMNCTKVPFLWRRELITPETLGKNLSLLPGIVVGALLGRWLMHHIPARAFTTAVLILSAISGVALLWR